MTGQPFPEITLLIDFQFPGSDLIAVLPYVIPLLFIGLILLLYQRYMDHESIKRNITLFFGIVCFLTSILLVIYGGYGSYWWGPEELTFGSWGYFIAGLQWMTDTLFGSVIIGTAYVVIIAVLFTLLSMRVIAPPDPDFQRLNNELKEVRSEYEQVRKALQELEAENKKLNEFLSQKEEALSSLDQEVSSLKESIQEREAEIARITATMAAPVDTSEIEAELLQTISAKDQTISNLQDKIQELEAELAASSTAPTVESDVLANLRKQVEELQSKMEEYQKRSQFANDVLDSVVTEFAQLTQQISSSNIDPASQQVLTGLLEALGKSIDKLTSPPPDKPIEEPRVELIGAVILMHDVVDTIKKIIRQTS